MKIKIDGSLCVTCKSYRQHYGRDWQGNYEAIDAGYCWKQHVVVRPGDWCGEYTEKPNVGMAAVQMTGQDATGVGRQGDGWRGSVKIKKIFSCNADVR